ncbi:MAG: FAD-dependent oxidoreductase, partial [Syntrophaceae bacterium]
MSKRFDVIIIGAGPAGIACAQALAGSSLSVLLVEKNDTIGPKTCAGGLTRAAIDFGIPEGQARTFHSQTVRLDSQPPLKIILTHPLKTVSRTALARHHLQGIERAANIEVVTGTKVTGLTDSSIATDRGDFSYRVLVAADGSQSIVRRHVGLPSKFGIGLYYEAPERSDDVLFQFRPGIIRSGYIWVFPHRDSTNVGIGFNPDTLTAGLAKVILQQYMKEKGFTANGARLRGG